MAMIKAKVLVKEEVQKEIAYHVIRSQNNRSVKVAREILDQKRMIPLARFANVWRTTWSKSIRKVNCGIFQHEDCVKSLDEDSEEGLKRSMVEEQGGE